MAHTFTAPVTAWISKHSALNAADLQETTDLNGITVWPEANDMSAYGYTKIGRGSVTLTIDGADKITAYRVSLLRAELEKDRADSQVRQNALIRKISELEALTYEVAA